ncbi:Hypp3552 [Branchiostoma lanceolatum]|uniref:Hypp3552 protein n=1 Tax=Branchiostoma lanceolatum TaxID=7740 RepID=A0A8K0A2H7_BRALA|nr:Hypp3552 [Branchiostoma lanceolatum]
MADGGSITGKRKRVSRGGRRQDTAKKRKEKERVRNTSRVFLDYVFDDWKDLRKELELERDRDLARLLIDRISVLFSDDEEEDWTDDECEDLDWIDDKSADPDYEPTARIKAALKVPSNFNIEDLEVSTAEEEVYDHLGDDVETDEEEVEEDNGGKEINSTSPKHSAPQVEVKVEREEDLIGEKCCLAYKQCLLELVKFLDSGRSCSEPGCKGKVEPQTRMVGTAMVIESICSCGQKQWIWRSQPRFKFGLQAGDFMLATNILLSGNNYRKISLLFKFLNLGCVCQSTFCSIQNQYCLPAIQDFWTEMVTSSTERMKMKDGVVLLDPEKGQYGVRGIVHSLDMWHGAKNLLKKIVAAGQEKGCSGLKEWTSDIVNHFWWCCGKANDYKEFMELWEGMLHHVCDEHEWALGRCRHHDDEDDNEDDSLSATEETQKKPKTPLVPNSVAVRKLTSIALDKTWLKKVHKYLNFRYKRKFQKKSERWTANTMKEPKKYEYISQLQGLIIRKRITSNRGMSRKQPRPENDPRRRGTLSALPAPPTAMLVQQHRSRKNLTI